MIRKSRSLSVSLFLAGLPLLLGGCILAIPISQMCYEGEGCLVLGLLGLAFDTECWNATTDANGCVEGTSPSGRHFQGCDLIPNQAYALCLTWGDPLLVEWPDTWNCSGGSWSAPSIPASGQILVEPASNYVLPAQFGTIVTDPGFSAHVIHLDVSGLPSTQINVQLYFGVQPGAPDNACLKGIDVDLVTANPGGHKFALPTEGIGVDFTAIQGPGVHRVCLGPDSTTATRRPTWGGLKTIYR